MSITRSHTNERSSKIVSHNGVIYLSGQVGDGETLAEQTHDCLGRVDKLLAEAGSSREKILQATIWLSDISYFAEFNKMWNDWVPSAVIPALASFLILL